MTCSGPNKHCILKKITVISKMIQQYSWWCRFSKVEAGVVAASFPAAVVCGSFRVEAVMTKKWAILEWTSLWWELLWLVCNKVNDRYLLAGSQMITAGTYDLCVLHELTLSFSSVRNTFIISLTFHCNKWNTIMLGADGSTLKCLKPAASVDLRSMR